MPSELEIRSKDRTLVTTVVVDEAVLAILVRLLDPLIRKDINFGKHGRITIDYGPRPPIKVALTRHY